MARTVLQLIERVGQILDQSHFVNDTFNSSGHTATAFVADILERWADSSFYGKHLYIDGGTPSRRDHIITASSQTDGQLSVRPGTAAVPNSLTFMILAASRQDIVDYLTAAILELHDNGDLVREFEMRGLVGGSPLYNAGFDYWTSSTTPHGWSRNGSATLARERNSSFLFASEQSLKVSGSVDYIKLDEPFKRYLEDLKGETVRMFFPVKTSTGSAARINLYTGSNNYSSHHSGNGNWQVLDTGNITVSSTATDLEPRLYNDTTSAVYFADGWITTSASIRDIPWPIQLMSRIHRVDESSASQRPDGDSVGVARQLGSLSVLHQYRDRRHTDEATTTQLGLLQFWGDSIPAGEHRLVITGSGPLALPSADTDNVEVDQTEAEIVVSLAAAMLLEDAIPGRSLSAQTDLRGRAARLRATVSELAGGYGQRANAPTMPRVL
jgi:hypothetical protein